MFFERYGVSIMIRYKIFFVFLFLVCFLGGCSGSDDKSETAIETDTIGDQVDDSSLVDNVIVDEPEEKVSKELYPEAEAMQKALNDAITRIKYGDKSGLYENEFEYLIDEKPFEEYITFPQIVNAKADTIDFVEVLKYEPREDNSAIVDVIVHFLGPTGVRTDYSDMIRMYKHKGRWIKPTVSSILHQKNYEEIMRQAESDAEEEARKDSK